MTKEQPHQGLEVISGDSDRQPMQDTTFTNATLNDIYTMQPNGTAKNLLPYLEVTDKLASLDAIEFQDFMLELEDAFKIEIPYAASDGFETLRDVDRYIQSVRDDMSKSEVKERVRKVFDRL